MNLSATESERLAIFVDMVEYNDLISIIDDARTVKGHVSIQLTITSDGSECVSCVSEIDPDRIRFEKSLNSLIISDGCYFFKIPRPCGWVFYESEEDTDSVAAQFSIILDHRIFTLRFTYDTEAIEKLWPEEGGHRDDIC